MEDIYQWCREGNSLQTKVWLDDISHDLNTGDDHGFTPLHWATKGGHLYIVQILLDKGAKVNVTNMGDDTALHLAAANGYNDCVQIILKYKPDINAQNEHGNTPLHYACFWGYESTAEILIKNNASLILCNKYNETPLDKCKNILLNKLLQLSNELNLDTQSKIGFKNQNKIRSCDPMLSKYCGIPKEDLNLKEKISSSQSGDSYKGIWQNNIIIAKYINLGQDPKDNFIKRACCSFKDEYPKLRIFSHPNILPVLGCINDSPNLIVISQYVPNGSLYNVLHKKTDLIIDQFQSIKFFIDISKGMAFLHTLNLDILDRFYLNSKHVYIDIDLTAKLNMADTKFSFQEINKFYYPAWMSPEALQKKFSNINKRASDMWSFAVLLWEIVTRQVPFAEYSPMETGMKIALEEMRLSIPQTISIHLIRLIKICMNEDPGKRPTFEQIIPILQKIALV